MQISVFNVYCCLVRHLARLVCWCCVYFLLTRVAFQRCCPVPRSHTCSCASHSGLHRFAVFCHHAMFVLDKHTTAENKHTNRTQTNNNQRPRSKQNRDRRWQNHEIHYASQMPETTGPKESWQRGTKTRTVVNANVVNNLRRPPPGGGRGAKHSPDEFRILENRKLMKIEFGKSKPN